MSHLTEEVLINIPQTVLSTWVAFLIAFALVTVLVYSLLHIWKYDLMPEIKRWLTWRRLSKGVKK